MSEQVTILVGTRKGIVFVEGDPSRADWSIRGPYNTDWPFNHVVRDPATGQVLAAGASPWYGPAVLRSDDDGETWTQTSEGITYGSDGPEITAYWHLAPVDGALYLGVAPAGLFRSTDGGESWTHVSGLRRHPTCPDWQPGAGGMCLHSIVPHRSDPGRMWVAASAVGVFETADGGETWETRNRNLRGVDPEGEPPEVGYCVHKLLPAAGDPDHLWQQNHVGTWRSLDGGASWTEITEGLPTDFGFPIVAHPRDPDRAWVVPLTDPMNGRLMVDGSAAVWHTADGGSTWERQSEGLPQQDAFLGVYREATSQDGLDPLGVYVGTSTGELFATSDEGGSWSCIAAHLPPILSVEAVVT